MFDKKNLKAFISGILLSGFVGGIWAYDFSHYMLLTGWVSFLLLPKLEQLNKFSNPPQIIVGYVVSCTLFVYVTICGFASLFTILDFSWINMTYAAHRLKIISIFVQNPNNVVVAIFAEILFTYGVPYLGSYNYLILDLGIAYSALYTSIFLSLNEEKLKLVFHLFCALLPTLTGWFYFGKYVIVGIVGAVSAMLYFFGQRLVCSMQSQIFTRCWTTLYEGFTSQVF